MRIFSPQSLYRLDRAAVECDGLTEIELMGRAGRRVWREISARWPNTDRITIFAGHGNNGGDAFVVALAAAADGVEVQMILQGELARQSATSRHYSAAWRAGGGVIDDWQGQAINGEIVVDGLLGIGLERDLNQDWQALIATINACDRPRVAIDIPSGLHGATGVPRPVAVAADLTVSFIAAKTGQFVADGPDQCGELVLDGLGLSRSARAGVEPQLRLIDGARLPPPRRRNSHKNAFGNLLIVGGDQGMSGAVALAARAALRSGAGLVTALVHPQCRANLAAFPEIMVSAWDAIEDKLAAADVLVVGPGLGGGPEARQCLRKLHQARQPLVVDAGGLFADFLDLLDSTRRVITPHPGEAARLLGCGGQEIQADRPRAAARLAERFGATCVLKGADTLIAGEGRLTAINHRGHPGMASAGMGDVLSGVIAALIGQGMAPFDAACDGVYLHALAAERFCRGGGSIGMIASDVIDALPATLGDLREA